MPTVKNYDHRFLAINLPRMHQEMVETKLRATYPDIQIVERYDSVRLPMTHVILLIDLGCEPPHPTRVWLNQREDEGVITFWHTYYPEREEITDEQETRTTDTSDTDTR